MLVLRPVHSRIVSHGLEGQQHVSATHLPYDAAVIVLHGNATVACVHEAVHDVTEVRLRCYRFDLAAHIVGDFTFRRAMEWFQEFGCVKPTGAYGKVRSACALAVYSAIIGILAPIVQVIFFARPLEAKGCKMPLSEKEQI